MKCKIFVGFSATVEKEINDWFTKKESELFGKGDYHRLQIINTTQSGSSDIMYITIIYNIVENKK